MVLNTQQTDRIQSEHQACTSEGKEWLAARRNDLIGRLEKALMATSFSNRSTMSPSHLPGVAQTEVDAFQSFLETGQIEDVRKKGIQHAEEGLGRQAVLRLGTTLRQFCRDHAGDKLAQASDVYADALLEGFMEGKESFN